MVFTFATVDSLLPPSTVFPIENILSTFFSMVFHILRIIFDRIRCNMIKILFPQNANYAENSFQTQQSIYFDPIGKVVNRQLKTIESDNFPVIKCPF